MSGSQDKKSSKYNKFNVTKKTAAAGLMVMLVFSGAPGLIFGDDAPEFLQTASATHGRYTHLTWESVDETTVEFSFHAAWRHDGYSRSRSCVDQDTIGGTLSTTFCSGDDNLPVVGDIISEHIGGTDFRTGDGRIIDSFTGNLLFLVTEVDEPINALFGEAIDPVSLEEDGEIDTDITHDYQVTDQDFIAFTETCCRISSFDNPNRHVNNGGDSYRMETVVNTGDSNRPPASAMPPIQQCPRDDVCQFTVPPGESTDADGDPVQYRLSTSAEAQGSGTFTQPGEGQSGVDNLEINATTGIVTWNTTGATFDETRNTLYSIQVMVEDLDQNGNPKSHVPVDFLIHLVEDIEDAPSFVHPPTPECGGVLEASIGSEISFTVEAASDNESREINITGTNVPSGAVFEPVTADNPVQREFSWVPQTGDLSQARVMQFQARDNVGLTETCTITIAQEGVDLEVYRLDAHSLSGNANSISPGDDIQVRAHIRNNGAGTVPEADVEFDIAGQKTVLSNSWNPVQSRVMVVHDQIDDQGRLEISVTADHTQEIDEFNETNNQQTMTIVAESGLDILGVSSVTYDELGTIHTPGFFVPEERVTIRFDAPPGHTDIDDLEVHLGGTSLEVVENDTVGASHYADVDLPDEISQTRDRFQDTPRDEEVYNHTLRIKTGGLEAKHSLPVAFSGAKVGVDQPTQGLEEAGTDVTRDQAIGKLGLAFVENGSLVKPSEYLHAAGASPERADSIFYRIVGGSVSTWRPLVVHEDADHPRFVTGDFVVVGEPETGEDVRVLVADSPRENDPVPLFLPSSASAPIRAYEQERSIGGGPLFSDLANANEMTVGETYIASGSVENAALPDYKVEWVTLDLVFDGAPAFATGDTCLELPLAGSQPHAFAFAVQPEETGTSDISVEGYRGQHCGEVLPDTALDTLASATLSVVDSGTGASSDAHLEAVLQDRVDSLSDQAVRTVIGNEAWRQFVFETAFQQYLQDRGLEGMDAATINDDGLTPGWTTEDGLVRLFEQSETGQQALADLGITDPTSRSDVETGLDAITFADLDDAIIAFNSTGTVQGAEVTAHLMEVRDKMKPLVDAVETNDLWTAGTPRLNASAPADVQALAWEWDQATYSMGLSETREGVAMSIPTFFGAPSPPMATPPRPGLDNDVCSDATLCWDFNQPRLHSMGSDPNRQAGTVDSYRAFSEGSVAAKHPFDPIQDLHETFLAEEGVHGDEVLGITGEDLAGEPRNGHYAAWAAGFNATRIEPNTQVIELLETVSPYGLETSHQEHDFVPAGEKVNHTHTFTPHVDHVNVTVTSFGDALNFSVEADGVVHPHMAENVTADPLNRTWIEIDLDGAGDLEVEVQGDAANTTGYLLHVSEFLDATAREVHVLPVTPAGQPIADATVAVEDQDGLLTVSQSGARYETVAETGDQLEVNVTAAGYRNELSQLEVAESDPGRIIVVLEMTPILDADPLEIVIGKPETQNHDLPITNNDPDNMLGFEVIWVEGPAAKLVDPESPSTFTVPAGGQENLDLEVSTLRETQIGVYPGTVNFMHSGVTKIPIEVHVLGPEIAVSDPFVHLKFLNATEETQRDVWFENQGLADSTGTAMDINVPYWVNVTTDPSTVPADLSPDDRVTVSLEANPGWAGVDPSLSHGWLTLTNEETRQTNVTVLFENLIEIEAPPETPSDPPGDDPPADGEEPTISIDLGDMDGSGDNEQGSVTTGSLFVGVEKENQVAAFGFNLGNIIVTHDTDGAVIDASQVDADSQWGYAENVTGLGDRLVTKWTDGDATLERRVELVTGGDTGDLVDMILEYEVTGVSPGELTLQQDYSAVGEFEDGVLRPGPDWEAGEGQPLPQIVTQSSRSLEVTDETLTWTFAAMSGGSVSFPMTPQSGYAIEDLWDDHAALDGTTVDVAGIVVGVYEDRFVLEDDTGAILVNGVGTGEVEIGDVVNVTGDMDGPAPNLQLVDPVVEEPEDTSGLPDARALPADHLQVLLDSGHIPVETQGQVKGIGATHGVFDVDGQEVPIYDWYQADPPRIQPFENVNVTGFLFEGSEGTGLLLDSYEKRPFFEGDIEIEDMEYFIEDIPDFTLDGSILMSNVDLTVRNTEVTFGAVSNPHTVELTEGSTLTLQDATLDTDGHLHFIMEDDSEATISDGSIQASSYALEAGSDLEVSGAESGLFCAASEADAITEDTLLDEDQTCGSLPTGGAGGGGGSGAVDDVPPTEVPAEATGSTGGGGAGWQAGGVSGDAGTVFEVTGIDDLPPFEFTVAHDVEDAEIDVTVWPSDRPPENVGELPPGTSSASFVQVKISTGGSTHEVVVQVAADPTDVDPDRAVVLKWNEDTQSWDALDRIDLTLEDDRLVGSFSSACCSDWAVVMDGEDPSVVLASLGDIEEGVVTLSAQADDNVAVDRVEFYIGDELVGTDSSAPYELSWDASAGDHLVRAVAFDLVDNNAEDSQSVAVQESGSSAGQQAEEEGSPGIGALLLLSVLAVALGAMAVRRRQNR